MSDQPEISASAIPDPGQFDFDLPGALSSVVSLRTSIPEDALTAQVLGTERAGHGVLIEQGGLILTIGYLVTEADGVWITDCDGKTVGGYVVGYDQETGFGLVQAMQTIGGMALELGSATDLEAGDGVVVAGHGGLAQAIGATVTAKREFAGYWEYVLDEAIFTTPAHPNWGGAALIGPGGALTGIGSLLVQQVGPDGEPKGANMMVPIDLLPPVLDDLKLYGRRNEPPRPWLGWLVQEIGQHLVVAGLYHGRPAHESGLDVGDVILEINGQPVSALADLFRKIWALGPAGVEVPITIAQDEGSRTIAVASVDRNACLKSASVH